MMLPLSETADRPRFNRLPMLWLAVFFAVGILIDQFVSIDITFALAIAATTAILAVLISNRNYATCLILLAFAAAGALTAQAEMASISVDRVKVIYDSGTIASGEPVELEGVMKGGPELAVGGVFLELHAQSITHHGIERKASGNVRVFLPDPVDSGSSVAESDADLSESPDLKSEITDLKPDRSENSDLSTELKYGSRLRVFCKLNRDDEYLNPGVIPKREVLDRLGLDATGTIKSRLLVQELADESVFIPLAWVYNQRARLINEFHQNLDGQTAGIMIASLLGDKYFLDRNTAELFREGGTFHVLVISGLHITFIGGLLLLLVRLFTRNRWMQFAVAVTIMWAYTFAVGADLPVVRAAIMFSVVSFSYVIYRTGTALNSLGLCMLLLLAWRPPDLFNPSFQLTFVSVAAIIAIAMPLIGLLRDIGSWTPTAQKPFPPNVPGWLKRFCESLYWREISWSIESKRQIWTARLFKSPFIPAKLTDTVQKLVRYLFEALLVSLIVQISMLPLSVWYFHRVSLAGIVLNIWVGVFLAIESFAAVAAACLGQISAFLSQPVYLFSDKLNWMLLALPRLLSGMEWANFRLPAYPGKGVLLYLTYFLPVLVLAIALNRWRPFELGNSFSFRQASILRTVAAALAMFIAAIIFHPFSALGIDGRFHMDFLDVGQGDAALVTFPDGQTLLVDGGGRRRSVVYDQETEEPFEQDVRSVGEAVDSAFLWNRGYSHVDYILATHADSDHIQGLTDVAKNFTVSTAIFGRAPIQNPNFAELANVLIKRDIPVEIIAARDRMKFGDVTVEVLYPLPTDDVEAISDNDHSVVLRFVYGSRSFLMTGDIERGAESAILNSGMAVGADVIKVAHHGSRTSSTQAFIDAVGADDAIISVGRASPFGHPHPEVVERWRGSGAHVFQTGQRGMVSVSTDGSDLQIDTFLP